MIYKSNKEFTVYENYASSNIKINIKEENNYYQNQCAEVAYKYPKLKC